MWDCSSVSLYCRHTSFEGDRNKTKIKITFVVLIAFVWSSWVLISYNDRYRQLFIVLSLSLKPCTVVCILAIGEWKQNFEKTRESVTFVNALRGNLQSLVIAWFCSFFIKLCNEKDILWQSWTYPSVYSCRYKQHISLIHLLYKPINHLPPHLLTTQQQVITTDYKTNSTGDSRNARL